MSDRWPNLRRVFRLPLATTRAHEDVDAELSFHVAGRIDELIASGMSPEEAQREAHRRFGDFTRIEAEVERLERRRRQRRSMRDRLETLIADVRFAVRSVLRQPIYAVVVVATMTLGIGTTAAIFHAVDRIVLHPLPYPDADRIVFLGTQRSYGLDVGAVTARRYQFWHDQSRVFERLATSTGFEATLDGAENDIVEGKRVTSEFLTVVGAPPTLGRALLPDDYTPAATPTAVISDGLWKRKFGGERDVIGKSIRLDSTRYTIVGVLPPGFEIAEDRNAPDVLLPLVLSASQLEDGGANWTTIGKLRRDVTPAQIDADMTSVFAHFRELYPQQVDTDDRGVAVIDFQHMAGGSLTKLLWIFFGATAFVFVLACANVANIVLARAIGRQREFAVRTALGAGRARIVRQVLLEMLVLGAISAVFATVASLITVRWISKLGMQLFIRQSQLNLDWRAVLYATTMATLASIVIGFVVAMMTSRIDVTKGLSASTRSSGIGDRRGTLRAALVTTEAALAMVLLTGAALLITSFVRVLQVDGGFRRQAVYTAHLARTPRSYVDADAVWQFDQRVLAKLRATPGIESAASTATLPLERGWNTPTTVEGRDDATIGGTEWRSVSPGYFRAMDIKLLAGRDFDESDTRTAPPVVIVSKSYASKLFPDENPIGRRIYIGVYHGRNKARVVPSEIVGVVTDLRDRSLDQSQLRQTIWVSHAQAGRRMGANLSSFVVRATDPSLAATALRHAIADADPELPVADVASMNDIVLQSLGNRRFSMVLLTSFALVAVMLTCVGIYGVAAYSVSQRTREIGVRIALGAQPRSVVGLVIRQGVRPALLGLGIGLVLALIVSRVIASLLFGIGPRDPLSLMIVAALLAIVTLVATWLPAQRAARVDPVQALRAD